MNKKMESTKLKKKVIRRYADRRFCICGHLAADHYLRYPNTISACNQWVTFPTNQFGNDVGSCGCFEFKLDNLAYIEQLAQERNLI